MIATTLNKIRDAGPCEDGYEQLLRHLGKTKADDEPLLLLTILDSNGLEDCLWWLRTVPEHNHLWRHFAVDCAEQVQHLMTDDRSLNALKVARRHADGQATDVEFCAARAAARAAARDARDARAAEAARAAARAAAEAAAGGAYWAAGAAAEAAAWATAEAAAAGAAEAAAQKWQEQRLRELLIAEKWSNAK